MKKRIFMAALIAITAVSLVFAGGKSDSGSKAAGGAKKPITLTMFVDETWWPYKTFDGDMPKWFTEKTGITFDVTVCATQEELPILVASGEMPDVLIVSDRNTNLMNDPNISYDWQSLIEKYNIDWNIHPAYQFSQQAADGKVYSIRVGWSADYEFKKYPTVSPEGRGAAWRDDIMAGYFKESGKDNIYTMDDFEGALEYCKKNYPDVIPFVINMDFGIATYFEALYGVAREFLMTEDNQVKPYIYGKNLQAALLKMNEWARKGYIRAENINWYSSTTPDLITSGKVFFYCNLSQSASAANQYCKDSGVADKYHYTCINKLKLPTSNEIFSVNGWRGFYISKKCKDPKAAIEAAKFFCSKDDGYTMLWGIPETDWTWNADKTVATMKYDINDTEFSNKRQFSWGWLGHDGISNSMKYMSNPEIVRGLDWVGSIQKQDPIAGVVYNRLVPGSKEHVIYLNLVELARTDFPKVVFAGSQADAQKAFTDMMKTADSLGGQDLIKWASKDYAKLNADYEKVRSIGAEGWQKGYKVK